MIQSSSPEPLQENKGQKKKQAQKTWDKLRHRGKQELLPDPNDKKEQTQPGNVQRPAGKLPTSINKQLPAVHHNGIRDEDDMEKLRREYKDIKRGLSIDTVEDKSVGSHLTMVHTATGMVPYDSKLGKRTSLNHVTSVTHVPAMPHPPHQSSEATNIVPPQLIPGNGSTQHAMVTHPTFVNGPENRNVNRSAWTQHGSSLPQQGQYQNLNEANINGYTGLSSQPFQHHQFEGQTDNINASQSLEGLRSELQVIQFNKQQLERQLQEARNDASDSKARLKLLQEAHNTNLQDLESLKMTHARDLPDIAQLRDTNAELQANMSHWQAEFDRVNDELFQLRRELSSYVNDQYFQDQWKDLQDKIENLSFQYFAGRVSKPFGSILSRPKGSNPDKLENLPPISLTRLTEEHARYLASEHERPLLIQAFIWYVLVNVVFAHKTFADRGFYWAGQSRELLYHLKGVLQPRRLNDVSQYTPAGLRCLESDARNYHKARAANALLLLSREPLDRRINHIRNLVEETTQDIVCIILPYAVVTKETPPPSAEVGIYKQLETIMQVAIETDAEMAQQRAWIFCEQWRARMEGEPIWGFQWNPEEADRIQIPEQNKGRRAQFKDPCVELIVQPALFREGNQYGQGYLTRQVLCKAKVVIGEHSGFPAIRRQ